ncbi:hypothetical protein Tco_1515246 [Tanacetum coccineum]
MANLDFCDKHNMVAFLKKPEGSEGFHQIVDFLNSTHIKYALTENPTIYVSLIHQFWQTASASTSENGEMEITATIDGRVKTVTEASIRRHLKLEDSDGISTLPNTEIFEQLALMGRGCGRPVCAGGGAGSEVGGRAGCGLAFRESGISVRFLRLMWKIGVGMESDRLVPKISTGSSKRTAKTELDHEGSKRQKTNEEQSAEEEKELSEEELQKLMMIVPVEEIYVEALQVKYPIIDWEVYSEDTRKYWKIIRVGNHTEAYQTFDDMLKKFDRDDLDKLWSLVKERFSSTDPTDDKERTLWVELKRLFEPDIDDILWKLQRYMHDPLTWKLYDTCGVHHVSTDRGHDIFMLVEKDYPLTRGILTLMLCNKLQVDQYSEMANELLKKIFILANRPRQ